MGAEESLRVDAGLPPGGPVYLDSAASTPLRTEAYEAMLPFLQAQFANPSAHHSAGRRASDSLEEARDRIARVFGAEPEEVVFTSGGTESINAAIKGVAFAQADAGGGRHLVTTAVEHHAVLHSMQYLERFGFEVEVLPVDEYGRVTPEEVASAVRPETALFSVGYANNEVGTVQSIAAIAAAVGARADALGKRIPFHTDAVQAASSHPLNVQTLGVDLLSLSGHKFGGPRGTGLLYMRRGIPFLELLSGGGQERQRRSGTENVPGNVGLAVALERAQAEREDFWAHTAKLRDRLLAAVLEASPDALVNGHPTERLPQALHVCFSGLEGEALVDELDRLGVEASAGAACTSATWEPSHVLLSMGVPLEMAIGSLRMSLWSTTTGAQVDYVSRAIPGAVSRVRKAALPARSGR